MKKNMLQGKIFILSAPSGVGKSSLIRALLKINPLSKMSISHTTRNPRSGEKNGIHYYFVSKKKFTHMIEKNNFLEYAKVFGNYYGTAYKTIKKMILENTNIFLDIDWQGARQIRKTISHVCSIFILPPSKKELNRRLCIRGKDSQKVILKRMEYAVEEIRHYIEYDYLIINDNFNLALSQLQSIICSSHLCVQHQKIEYNNLINNLLKI